MPNILVVEDDPAIARGVVDAIRYAGHVPYHARTVGEGREVLAGGRIDLMLLDVVLPDGLGWDLLTHLRQAGARVAVIVLTARGDERDRLTGLRGGADDYVVKPFSVKELLARIEAVLRRVPPASAPPVVVAVPGAEIRLDGATIAFEDGSTEELSAREVDLLTYLVRAGGRVVGREELLRAVWNLDPRGLTTRTIDMHVLRLREKLRQAADGAGPLVTVRGKGYRWAGPPPRRRSEERAATGAEGGARDRPGGAP